MRIPRALGCGKRNLRYADAADGLRVGCTLFVAWYHIWQQSWLNPRFEMGRMALDLRDQVATGYMGVELLLLLSGFLLYLPYAAGETPSLKEFYCKRALRILPSYWFCILVMLFVFAIPGGQFVSFGAMWKDLLAHFTFTHNLFRETYFATPLNGAMWTLAVEVQFYLIAPFICRAFRKQPGLVYGGMLAVSAAYRYFFVAPLGDTSYMLNRLPNLLEVYANGLLGAYCYGLLVKRGKQRAWDAWVCTGIAFLALWVLWQMTEGQGHVSGYEEIRWGQMDRRFLFSFCGAVFLVCGSRSILLVRRLLSNRAVRFLSGVSLNFYIWHQVLAVKLKLWRIPAYVSEQPNMAGEQPWQLFYTLVCFGAALLAAILVTYLVERPAAKLGRRLLAQKKQASD